MTATAASVALSPQITDFQLSAELASFRDFVREYCRQHLGDAARYDAETKFPRDPVTAAAKLGLLRTTVAKEHGGTAMGNLASCVMLEEINAVCASTGVTISVHNSLVNSLLGKWCNEAQKRRADILMLADAVWHVTRVVPIVPRHGYETARCAGHAAILNPVAASVSRAFCSALI